MIQRNLFQIEETLNIVLAANMNSVNEALVQTNFDIAIIDMDKLDGLFPQFINIARNTNPDIIIILLTSFPHAKIFEKFKNKGADYCLDKSNEFEELLNKIDELLSEGSRLKEVVGMRGNR
jgi:DNA-binding NarL/FixJ family response regulator